MGKIPHVVPGARLEHHRRFNETAPSWGKAPVLAAEPLQDQAEPRTPRTGEPPLLSFRGLNKVWLSPGARSVKSSPNPFRGACESALT